MTTLTAAPIKTFGSHAESTPEGFLTGVRFNSLVKLNERTNDGRLLRDTGFGSRELPLSFSVLTATQHGESGKAEVVGMVDMIEVYEDGDVQAYGWLMDSPNARMAGRMVQLQVLRGNSIELSVRDYEVDFDLEKMKMLVDFTDYQISATTLLANPAMEGCFLELEDAGFDFSADLTDDVVAAASSFTDGAFNPTLLGVSLPEGIGAFSVIERESAEDLAVDVPDDAPPTSFFSDPEFGEAFPGRILPVNDKGLMEVYGHIAEFGVPHLGVPGTTLIAPRSQTDYAYFANGETLCDDGSFVPTGVLTCGAGHADKGLDWRSATSHYDDSCFAWAAVAVGEDDFGIWYHGYVLPGTEPDMVTRCRALGLSGDWRRVRGNLELVAALSVNARGFPIGRPSAFSSGGLQTALTGAGALAPRPGNTMDEHYVPLDPESRVAINMMGAFVRKAEANDIRDALLADQSAELADVAAGLA